MLNLPSQVEMLRFDNRDLQMAALTEQISQQLRNGIAENQTASIALSGGRSPIPLFEQLSQQDLNWDKITATLVDDRWLPETEDDSNGRLVRQHLLQNQAAAADFIGLYQDGVDAYDGQETCNQRLSALPKQFDCIVLGMGNDGHTASLFPCSDDLATALSSTQKLCRSDTNHCTTCPHDTDTTSITAIETAYFAADGRRKTGNTGASIGRHDDRNDADTFVPTATSHYLLGSLTAINSRLTG